MSPMLIVRCMSCVFSVTGGGMVVMGGNYDDAHHASTHVKRLESLECCPGVRRRCGTED